MVAELLQETMCITDKRYRLHLAVYLLTLSCLPLRIPNDYKGGCEDCLIRILHIVEDAATFL
jgi:hypothetical protein